MPNSALSDSLAKLLENISVSPSLNGFQLLGRDSRNDRGPSPNEQTHGNGVRAVSAMVFARVRIGRQLGALARLEHREDDGADKCPNELRDGLIDVQYTEVDARQLACRAAVAVKVLGIVLQVEGVGAGELDSASVVRQPSVGRGFAGDFVDFHAHHSYRCP